LRSLADLPPLAEITGTGSDLIFEQFHGPPRTESPDKSGSGEPG
jgi:hypothetical protein